MSPRAACRLEQLGVTVHDYAGGKMDWLAHGLPYEGSADLVSRHLDDTAPPDLVTTDGGVVIGRREDDGTIDFGPTTVRASEERAELDHRMSHRGRDHILVTDPAGRFLGVYRREDDRGAPA